MQTSSADQIRATVREAYGAVASRKQHDCSDRLKEIIYRCIGERRKRCEDADELIAALRHPPAALGAGVLRSLDGVPLAFTGILKRPRAEAIVAAQKVGAVVHGMPSARTTRMDPAAARWHSMAGMLTTAGPWCLLADSAPPCVDLPTFT